MLCDSVVISDVPFSNWPAPDARRRCVSWRSKAIGTSDCCPGNGNGSARRSRCSRTRQSERCPKQAPVRGGATSSNKLSGWATCPWTRETDLALAPEMRSRFLSTKPCRNLELGWLDSSVANRLSISTWVTGQYQEFTQFCTRISN